MTTLTAVGWTLLLSLMTLPVGARPDSPSPYPGHKIASKRGLFVPQTLRLGRVQAPAYWTQPAAKLTRLPQGAVACLVPVQVTAKPATASWSFPTQKVARWPARSAMPPALCQVSE